jgi:hypothetical protein
LGVTEARALITKSKEIVPESSQQAGPAVVTQIHIIRHGETQGYSTESGLTPLGSWQVHRRGFDISKGVRAGERVHIACADTNRATQTAQGLRKGLLDGLDPVGQGGGGLRGHRHGGVPQLPGVDPEGMRDVTSAFRLYKKEMERFERLGSGKRPPWLVEMDRFSAEPSRVGPIRSPCGPRSRC